jgi:hypothetical protein
VEVFRAERIQVSQLHESKEAVSEAARGLVELGIQKEAVMDMFAETRCVSGFLLFFSIALNTLQAQLADNIACVCVNLDDDGYSVRYTRRIRSREFPPRAVLCRHLHQCQPAPHAHQGSPSDAFRRLRLLRWRAFLFPH